MYFARWINRLKSLNIEINLARDQFKKVEKNLFFKNQ